MMEFQILKHYGSVKIGYGDYTVQINKMQWYENSPKFDLRVWSPDQIPCNGFTLTSDELFRLNAILSKELVNDLPKPEVIYVKYDNQFSTKEALVLEHYGKVPSKHDWPIEVSLTQMGCETKFDIRRWEAKHSNYAAGVRFFNDEWETFKDLLQYTVTAILAVHTQPKPKRNFEDIIRGKGAKEIYELGLGWENGTDIFDGRDFSLAAKAFFEAGKLGHAEAICHLGYFFENGLDSVAQDEEKALSLYEDAKAKGSAAAAYNLGRCYENGIGVSEPDYKMAIDNYEIAASDNNQDALFRLGQIFEEGQLETNKNELIAQDYYYRAMKQGHLEAKIRYYALQG
jgi:hypothetical protein